MYVALPYVMYMEAMVSFLIHVESIPPVWKPCFLLY